MPEKIDYINKRKTYLLRMKYITKIGILLGDSKIHSVENIYMKLIFFSNN